MQQRAEIQILVAKKRVTDQIQVIARLCWFGGDTREAKALLRQFEIALAKHLSERERLRMQLALLEARSYSYRGPGQPASAGDGALMRCALKDSPEASGPCWSGAESNHPRVGGVDGPRLFEC